MKKYMISMTLEVLGLVILLGIILWVLGSTMAHAQAIGGLGGGLGDPQTFFQNVVTYGIGMGRTITACGAMYKAVRLYMGHYDFQGLGWLAGGAATFFGVPALLGVG